MVFCDKYKLSNVLLQTKLKSCLTAECFSFYFSQEAYSIFAENRLYSIYREQAVSLTAKQGRARKHAADFFRQPEL